MPLTISPERRSVVGKIAAIRRFHGPDDPRLPGLRAQLAVLSVREVARWAHDATRSLPDYSPREVNDLGNLIQRLDARLADIRGGLA